MICFPNAKINLGLSVISKRADGYHNMASVIYPVPLFDVLEFLPATEYSLQIFGEAIGIAEDKNLVSKAWSVLQRDFDIPPVAVKLLKRIPAGSGLGGGSSDAACMLKALNRHFQLNLEHDTLVRYAAEIGSDCIFFLGNQPALVSGKGEITVGVPNRLKHNWLLIVFPGFIISTKLAYASINPGSQTVEIASTYHNQKDLWHKNMVNDFEQYAFSKYPELMGIKQKLYSYGAFYASLTGSGSAIYGLFHEKPPPIPFGKGYETFIMKL